MFMISFKKICLTMKYFSYELNLFEIMQNKSHYKLIRDCIKYTLKQDVSFPVLLMIKFSH